MTSSEITDDNYGDSCPSCGRARWEHPRDDFPCGQRKASLASNLSSIRQRDTAGAGILDGSNRLVDGGLQCFKDRRWLLEELERQARWAKEWHRLVESIATTLNVNSAGGLVELSIGVTDAINALRRSSSSAVTAALSPETGVNDGG